MDLNEKEFIRHKLYHQKTSSFVKYQSLTSGEGSLGRFVRFELITSILGPLPGACGYLFRKWFFPTLFKQSGKNVVFGRNMTIRHPRNITIGDNVTFDDFVLLDGRGARERPISIGDHTVIGRQAIIQSKVGAIVIGRNCNIGTSSVIVAQGGVEIGEWTQIAGGCKISGGIFQPDPSTQTPFPFSRHSKGPILIGEKCFIGGSVQITDGVQIGARSLIGTGSVVMSNIPEGSIYMPRPGIVVGKTS